VDRLLEETQEREEIIERVAALDVGKAELVCCARVPAPAGRRRRVQEVTTYKTLTRSLLVMVDRLQELGVTRVVMEATSDYAHKRSPSNSRGGPPPHDRHHHLHRRPDTPWPPAGTTNWPLTVSALLSGKPRDEEMRAGQ
jgi:hypothetical protein